MQCSRHHCTNCYFQINPNNRNNHIAVTGNNRHSNSNCDNYSNHLICVNALNKSNQLQNGYGYDRPLIINTASTTTTTLPDYYCSKWNNEFITLSNRFLEKDDDDVADTSVDADFLQTGDGVKFNLLECTSLMIMNSSRLWDNNMFCYRSLKNNNNPLLNKRWQQSVSSRGGVNTVCNINKFKSVFLALIVLFAFCVNIAGGGKSFSIDFTGFNLFQCSIKLFALYVYY